MENNTYINDLVTYKDALIKATNLIKIQDKYITFLSKEINKAATFMHNHNIVTPRTIIEEGQELRKQIREHKENFNDKYTPPKTR